MEDTQLEKQIQKQVEELETLRNYTGADEITSLAGIDFKDDTADYFKTKIPTLDKLTEGFTPGELVIISGITKCGKTTLAKTFTESFATQAIPCLWFSYEMPLRQFAKTFTKVPEGVFVPLTLKNSTLLWIRSKILEAILKFNAKIIFIDHLGFLEDLAKKQDRRIEIDTIVRELKRMAIEYEILIFLIHHITKIEVGHIPAYENLKESSAVAQDSDKVLMIWREFKKVRGEFEFTGNTKLSVELDRRTGTYKKSMVLQFKNNKFTELYEDHTADANSPIPDRQS